MASDRQELGDGFRAITTQGAWQRPQGLDPQRLLEQPASKPTKKAHQKMLRRLGRLNTFVRCPGCDQRGGVYYMYDPREVIRWCYQCGWKEAVDEP